MSIFRHFEDSLGEAFGKGLLLGGLVGMLAGAAIMLVALIVGGATR